MGGCRLAEGFGVGGGVVDLAEAEIVKGVGRLRTADSGKRGGIPFIRVCNQVMARSANPGH